MIFQHNYLIDLILKIKISLSQKKSIESQIKVKAKSIESQIKVKKNDEW